jgi:hypothetical protein
VTNEANKEKPRAKTKAKDQGKIATKTPKKCKRAEMRSATSKALR